MNRQTPRCKHGFYRAQVKCPECDGEVTMRSITNGKQTEDGNPWTRVARKPKAQDAPELG